MTATVPLPIEIEIGDLHKDFGPKQVLRGVNLRILAGDTVAIVGGSGCGKTVLLEHILGKHRPDRGWVRVADHSQPDMPLRDLAHIDEWQFNQIHRYWGVVFQRNALFSGTVYDNLALWLADARGLREEAIRPLAQAALAAVDLRHDDAFLATDHHELSGGMAKRLAIARAIAMEPAVLFYDEPTTGLDPVNAARVHDLIHSTHEAAVAGGTRTSVIITHDKDLLTRLRPRTVMLHEGVVHFDGSYAEFESAPSAVIRPYFDSMPILHQRIAAP